MLILIPAEYINVETLPWQSRNTKKSTGSIDERTHGRELLTGGRSKPHRQTPVPLQSPTMRDLPLCICRTASPHGSCRDFTCSGPPARTSVIQSDSRGLNHVCSAAEADMMHIVQSRKQVWFIQRKRERDREQREMDLHRITSLHLIIIRRSKMMPYLYFTCYLLASAPLRQPSVVPHSVEPSSTKKADVIDLTLESSSSSSSDEEDTDTPLKKRCVYITKSEEMHAKG